MICPLCKKEKSSLTEVFVARERNWESPGYNIQHIRRVNVCKDCGAEIQKSFEQQKVSMEISRFEKE